MDTAIGLFISGIVITSVFTLLFIIGRNWVSNESRKYQFEEEEEDDYVESVLYYTKLKMDNKNYTRLIETYVNKESDEKEEEED